MNSTLNSSRQGLSKVKVAENPKKSEWNNTELIPLKSSRTIYYPQNFKKLKNKKKVKLLKKSPRFELGE